MRSILSAAATAIGVAAVATLASIPAAADAQCTLYDSGGGSWIADTYIYPSGSFSVVTAGVVNFGTGAFGIGGAVAHRDTQDVVYFDAAGARHYFQPVIDWSNFSHGGVQTCRDPLVIYAAL